LADTALAGDLDLIRTQRPPSPRPGRTLAPNKIIQNWWLISWSNLPSYHGSAWAVGNLHLLSWLVLQPSPNPVQNVRLRNSNQATNVSFNCTCALTFRYCTKMQYTLFSTEAPIIVLTAFSRRWVAYQQTVIIILYLQNKARCKVN
jgi:hypothetical protein